MKPFARNLLAWYAAHQRDLPWRRTRDPYRIWIAETLLQQTRIETVIPYYERFLGRFPNAEALAAAPLDAVLKVWEGAGYYARARNLHRAARQVVTEFGGKLPKTVEELRTLPGVGRYTAGAIASIAFNQDAPILDGNVARVLARYYALRESPKRTSAQAQLWRWAEDLIPSGRARDFNQALMDLGATVCTPRGPNHAACPLRRGCRAYRLGIAEELPVKGPAKALPHQDIGVGIVWKRGQILIAQRKAEGLLGGLWEFPGGKREPGETFAACVRREVMEELGIEVQVGAEFAVVDHAYSHFAITMHAFRCDYVRGRPRALGCARWKWVRPGELEAYAFPKANRTIIKEIESRPC